MYSEIGKKCYICMSYDGNAVCAKKVQDGVKDNIW